MTKFGIGLSDNSHMDDIIVLKLRTVHYQGNCNGVGRFVPMVTSAVPISPVQKLVACL
jgi:hypothetical protein